MTNIDTIEQVRRELADDRDRNDAYLAAHPEIAAHAPAWADEITVHLDEKGVATGSYELDLAGMGWISTDFTHTGDTVTLSNERRITADIEFQEVAPEKLRRWAAGLLHAANELENEGA